MDAERREGAGGRRGLRYEEIPDPEFQKRWLEARRLTGEQVELAFRHGFDARDRFADRPFSEVEQYLRQSWEGMGAPAPWPAVADIVRVGYERYKGAGLAGSTDPGPEALARFPLRTAGGSLIGGGTLGERAFLGAAEPVAEFEGEGGPPVVGGRREPGPEPGGATGG